MGLVRLSLEEGDAIDLVIVISPDNEYQTGAYFSDLVLELNRNKEKIRSIKIVIADYLSRHYDRKVESIRSVEASPWYQANQATLATLNFTDDNIQVICWSDIIQSEHYKQLHKLVRAKFDNDLPNANDRRMIEDSSDTDTALDKLTLDLQYRQLVLSTASKFNHKGTKKQCVQYLLDETAGMLTLEGTLIYPGKLNPVLSYVINNDTFSLTQGDSKNLSFCAYTVKPIKRRRPTDFFLKPPSSCCNQHEEKSSTSSSLDNPNGNHELLQMAILITLKRVDFSGERSQTEFLRLFDQLCEKFSIDNGQATDASRVESGISMGQPAQGLH